MAFDMWALTVIFKFLHLLYNEQVKGILDGESRSLSEVISSIP